MPRVLNMLDYCSDDECETGRNIDPSEIGGAILAHIRLPADGIVRFHSEVNSKGLLLVLKSETEEKRLIVLGVDTTKEKLTPADALRLALDRIPAADRPDVLASMGLMERPTASADPGLPIASVFDLESVFSDPAPVNYLIEPEIPERSVVYVAGVPESGKTSLAYAWGRDLVAKRHAVLLLDRDRNPRSVIRDLLQRLGVKADNPLFSVWDSQQKSQPPQPDSAAVIDWVKWILEETGKLPLVIVDSAVSFLLPGEDENSSGDIRALFTRCRAVTDAGGSVLLLHHLGKNGELRGSSDFGAAADQGFIVTNSPEGAHLLSRLTLKVHKTRYALSADIVYNYDGGKMVRVERARGETAGADGSGTPNHDTTRKLTELLRDNPGIGANQFESSAHKGGVPHNQARKFLKAGVKSGKILLHVVGRKHEYRLRDGATESNRRNG